MGRNHRATTVQDKIDQDRMTPNQMCQTQALYCAHCGRFLAYQAIVMGVVKIKCRRCKEWTTIDVSPDN